MKATMESSTVNQKLSTASTKHLWILATLIIPPLTFHIKRQSLCLLGVRNNTDSWACYLTTLFWTVLKMLMQSLIITVDLRGQNMLLLYRFVKSHFVNVLMIMYGYVFLSEPSVMMTSSNGNFFRVTGPLWRESNGHRWNPLTKASDVRLWCFLWSALE